MCMYIVYLFELHIMEITKPVYEIDYPTVDCYGNYLIGEQEHYVENPKNFYNLDTGMVENRQQGDWVNRMSYIEKWVDEGWELLQILPKQEPFNKYCLYEYVWKKYETYIVE